MPQLSLKTILAYLDDALEARVLREVGEEIARSPELQELVSRIHRVTRRRSALGEGEPAEEPVPATVLAQYLEGNLPPEQAAELERQCLESDALLAEVAACHQLLHGGLRLDPSRIPPSAYQRMYGLLEGEGSARQTHPVMVARRADTSRERAILRDEEQALLLGLPTIASGPWSRRLVPLAVAVVLLCGLVISLFFALVRSTVVSTVPGEMAKVPVHESSTGAKPAEPSATNPPTPQPDFVPDAQQSRRLAGWLMLLPTLIGQGSLCPGCLTSLLVSELELESIASPLPEKQGRVSETPADIVVLPGAERLPQECVPREVSDLFGGVGPPVTDGRPLATLAATGVGETLLWWWSADGKQAGLVKPQERLLAGIRLQVWPGYRASLRLDSGVQVELVGNVPEIYPEPTLDSVCQLLTPQPPYHADLLLERGWFVITGRKEGPTRLRLRIADEVWDMYLPPGAPRVLVSVQKRLQRGQEPLRSQLAREFWTLESGLAWRRTTALGDSQTRSVFWRSHVLADLLDPELPQPAPVVVPIAQPPLWLDRPAKLPPVLRDGLLNFQRAVYQRAVENLAQPLAGARQALIEELDSNQRFEARLAVFALAASDQLDELLRVLDNRPQADIRHATREALHFWLGQYPDRANHLLELADRQFRYTPDEARLLLGLLRGYPAAELNVAELLLQIMLNGNRPALRYLAWANFRELYPNLKDNYSPDAGREAREKAVAVIRNQLR